MGGLRHWCTRMLLLRRQCGRLTKVLRFEMWLPKVESLLDFGPRCHTSPRWCRR